MEIKSLANTGFDTIFEAFSKAFADYEMQQDKEQLRSMLKRRGFNADLSFAAFEGDDIVAFTFNGIGSFEGATMAYDTGTGTLKEYRGKGLATQIFEHSLPYLKEAGVRQYLLEVLQHNTKAASVYRNLGFEVVREFYYSMQDNDKITNQVKIPDIPYDIKSINIEELSAATGFWDFYPSWQNSIESINRVAGDFICLGVFTMGQLIGYCVFDSTSGDITQIAIDRQYRRQGFASLLLERILELNKYASVKVINTDIHCESIIAFLEVKNIPIRGKQFEMIKRIV